VIVQTSVLEPAQPVVAPVRGAVDAVAASARPVLQLAALMRREREGRVKFQAA